MVFVFDVDDTLCATDIYSKKYIWKFIKTHKLPYKKINNHSRFGEGYFSWTTEEANKWYKEYGDQMALEFPTRKFVKQTINKLFDAGHKIIICTARANDWHNEPEKVTRDWLRLNGIKYTKLYFGSEAKEKVCESENANFFIDDDYKILSKVQSYFDSQKGIHKAFMSTTDFNNHQEPPKNVTKIKNFKAFEKEIKKYL